MSPRDFRDGFSWHSGVITHADENKQTGMALNGGTAEARTYDGWGRLASRAQGASEGWGRLNAESRRTQRARRGKQSAPAHRFRSPRALRAPWSAVACCRLSSRGLARAGLRAPDRVGGNVVEERASLGTPISRLASQSLPIRRLAFPGEGGCPGKSRTFLAGKGCPDRSRPPRDFRD